MEPIATYNLETIYAKLKPLGIDKRFIRDVLLPDWWSDEILSSKAGFLQTVSIIAKNLSVKLSDLLDPVEGRLLQPSVTVRFKSRSDEVSGQLFPYAVASKLSKLLTASYNTPFNSVLDSAPELRRKLFESRSLLNLENLIDFLWSLGVPVIYVSEIPATGQKFDGMTFRISNNPNIVVSSKRTQDAWYLFILAHELGHIALGHLNGDGNGIIDSNIEANNNDEEQKANDFAIRLLLEDPNNLPSFKLNGSPYDVVNKIFPLAKKLKVDAGSLALMIAYRDNSFAVASKAINIINPQPNAPKLIKMKMKEHLKLDKLTEEDREFFERITGLNGD
ncbi:MAG: ImmA/IrrE family metallo-endopeptidase [Ignavibacteriaceae bacterium]|nr:ImmA/IrrE family metallo-endopeptidase [Ignavibacteriaceae bacterium]